jgi:CubicO group peptidase (beta-lactamase class C family)
MKLISMTLGGGLALALVVHHPGQVSAQAAISISDEVVVDRVQQVIARALNQPEAVGLSVAVARGETMLLERGAGIADLEFNVPADAETMFRIGSVTKQFTAASILKLVEGGALTLDDDLHEYVPNFDTGGRRLRFVSYCSTLPACQATLASQLTSPKDRHGISRTKRSWSS